MSRYTGRRCSDSNGKYERDRITTGSAWTEGGGMKPCPHCGAQPLTHEFNYDAHTDCKVRVSCECGMTGPWAYREIDAIELWYSLPRASDFAAGPWLPASEASKESDYKCIVKKVSEYIVVKERLIEPADYYGDLDAMFGAVRFARINTEAEHA